MRIQGLDDHKGLDIPAAKAEPRTGSVAKSTSFLTCMTSFPIAAIVIKSKSSEMVVPYTCNPMIYRFTIYVLIQFGMGFERKQKLG
jgi:hypothetical protein